MRNESIENINSGFALFDELKSAKRKLISKKLILDKKDNHKYPIQEFPFLIPDYWKWCFLSDISIIQEGPGIRKHQYQEEGIQFLTVTNILEGSVDLEKSKKYISNEEFYEKYQHYKINKGDIVTACSGASWGKSAIYEDDETLMLNTSTLRLRFFNDLGENRYLYYLTKTDFFKANLASHSTGQQPNYGYSHYSKIPIPLPPLNEQQQIVSILDEAFAAIDKAKANAEQNLKNAAALFESYLHGVFEKKDDGWEEKKLGEIVDIINGRNQAQVISDNGKYPIYGSAANLMGYATDYLCEKGTTIIGRKGNISNPIFIDERFWNVDTAFGLYPKNGYNPKFINYLCQTIDFKSRNRGTTIPSLVKSDLITIDVPFVSSLKVQQTIVRQLDALRNETQKLETIYQKKIEDLEELKKSILQKAFAGELKTEKVILV